VRFTWDPKKSAANIRIRGFDFAFATLIFHGPTVEREDQRRAYGERRIVAIGRVGELHLTVVYTDRAEEPEIERRIIAAWRSNRRERKTYTEVLKTR